jgi:hypothetical protein
MNLVRLSFAWCPPWTPSNGLDGTSSHRTALRQSIRVAITRRATVALESF